ncbi:MAG: hypothetical protein V4719_25670 [Planctomycetota bacterium]
MKIRQKRLFELLRVHGFASNIISPISGDLTFVRSSHINELFESIIVGTQGKQGEAVYASVGIAITHAVMYELLGNVQFLDEMGEDPQRGWTIIEDDEKARQWETRLAEISSVRAKEMANRFGPQLLQETTELRSVVKKYESTLEPTMTPDKVLAALKSLRSNEVAVEAERLSSCPIFPNDGKKGTIYQIACHVIACRSVDIEGISFIGHDPMSDTALLARIELLADKLCQANDFVDVYAR